MSGVAVAIAAAAVIGAGTGMYASSQSAGAMGDAAGKQTDAAKYAADLQNQQYLTGRNDLAPWRETGKGALAQLNYLMGQPQIEEPAAPPGQVLVNGVPQTSYNVKGKEGNFYSLGSIDYSAPGWKEATNDLYARARSIPGATVQRIGGQTHLLVPAPAAETGGTATGKTPYWGEAGQFTKPFTFDQTDPSYQWRFQQGQEAVNQSAAAKGGYFSGQTGIDLQNYGQGAASTEYQSEFNRYMAETQNLYNMLAGISGTGQTASTSTASMGANAASNAGNITMTGAANAGNLNAEAAKAMASGYQGASNQVMSGAGTYLNYQQMNNLLAQLGGGGGYDFSLGGVPYTP